MYAIYFLFCILPSIFVNSVMKVCNGSFLDFGGRYIFPITVDFFDVWFDISIDCDSHMFELFP